MSFIATHLTGFGARRAAAAAAGGTWSTTLKNSHVTLSNANLRATSSGIVSSAATVLGGTARSSGKGYAEITLVTSTTNNIIGFATATATTADGGRPGFDDTQGWGYYAGSGSTIWNAALSTGTGGGTSTTGDIISLAYDAGTGKIWWAKNGTWFHSGDPGAGTNQETTNPGAGATLYLFACFRANSDVMDINTGGSAFTYSLPSGFSAWG